MEKIMSITEIKIISEHPYRYTLYEGKLADSHLALYDKVERLEKELAMYKGNINVKQDFRNLRKMDKTKIGSAKLEAK